MLENDEKKLTKAIEECTFTPTLNKKPKYLKGYENIIEKTRKSQQFKEQKSLDSHQNYKETDLRECTFTPIISQYKPKNLNSRSNSLSKSKPESRILTNSFQKSQSSSSLFRKNPLRTISRVSSSSNKGEFSSNSSRSSFKKDEKVRFQKSNEAFMKNKGKNQSVFQFEKKKKEKKREIVNKTMDSEKHEKIREEFSKEITETLNIFTKIRMQINKGDKDKNKRSFNGKIVRNGDKFTKDLSSKKILERNSSKNSILSKNSNFSRNSSTKKILERNNSILSKNSNIKKKEIEKKLNSIGKLSRNCYAGRRELKENKENTTKFSSKLIEMYKEDVNSKGRSCKYKSFFRKKGLI